MNRIAAYIIFFLLPAWLIQSCTPGSCQDEILSKAEAGLYRTGTGKAVIADSLTLISIGKVKDTLYFRSRKIQSFSFPLDPDNDTSSFYIKINNLTDTISVVYTSFPRMVSKECGFTFFNTIDSVFNRSSLFDYQLKLKNVTPFDEENIRIFF